MSSMVPKHGSAANQDIAFDQGKDPNQADTISKPAANAPIHRKEVSGVSKTEDLAGVGTQFSELPARDLIFRLPGE
ncbi:hypothetical protein ACHAQA_007796 [Verticillium albo-atrum]